MSMKERRRLAVLEQVKAGQITLRLAADRLEISERQAKRLHARFKAEGDGGLMHRLRGRPSNRGVDGSMRDRAVSLYREHYEGFGAVLASEYLLASHQLTVKPGTLRRWLIAEGLWGRRRRSRAKHRRRERRACFGELVQLDGSDHDWFEGRGPRCVAMVMIDDATNWMHVRFAAGETTQSAMLIFRDWSRRHGLPVQVYPDRHSIYRVNTQAADEIEARTDKRPPTQFGRAMQDLGVRLQCAHSPQAKGRVERANGTLQDRLVKALRLAGISDIEQANRFLESAGGGFLPDYNARFARRPANAADAHMKVSEEQLEQALCVREQRVAGRDQCISWHGQVLQLDPGRRVASLAAKRVQVDQGLDGAVRVHRGGKLIQHVTLPARPQAPPADESLADRVKAHAPAWKPPAEHAWRRAASVGRGCSAALRSPGPPT